MKKIVILFTMLALIVPAAPTMAKDFISPAGDNAALMEDNLLLGLSANNIGVQQSCALLLGKMQSDKAVIPLLALFNYNSDENLRIAAAWALCMIGDVRGVDAVKIAAKNDECPRVRAVCALYNENMEKEGKFSLVQPDDKIVN